MGMYLVTGAAGFIGSAIAEKLINAGHRVVTIDNLSTGYESSIPKGCEFVFGNCQDPEVYGKIPQDKYDAVLHLAGQSSGEISFEDPEYDLNTNTLSTLKLLEYCVKTGCKKIVYASTMSVYGEQENQERFSELDQTNPKSFYAVGKLASEKYMEIFSKQFGIDYVALRYFNVYGPGQNLENLKQGMVSIYLKQILDDKFKNVVVKGDLNRFRDLIYVDDVVDITIEAIKNDKYINKIINVGTGKKTMVHEILTLIKEQTNSTKEILITEGTLGDQFGIFADNKLLLSLYRKPLTNFKTGLKKMINWIKEA